MPKVKNVEKKIWDVEGFDVAILHGDGKDIRGDKKGIPQYTFDKAAQNSFTIKEWTKKRFLKKYPGFQVKVFNADNVEVSGNTTLGNLRDTYLED
jgi:hypothetical protein